MKKSLKVWFLSTVLLCGMMFLSSSVFANDTGKLKVDSGKVDKMMQHSLDQWMKKIRETQQAEEKKQQAEEKKQQAEKARQAQEAQNREVWITINTECMWGVGCGFSVYDSLGIRKGRAEGERTSVMLFLQDIILGASMFIGTVAAVAFILSGVYYIFSASDASYKKKAQEGMKYAVYGLVLVTLAIVIVRITQFIARGGS